MTETPLGSSRTPAQIHGRGKPIGLPLLFGAVWLATSFFSTAARADIELTFGTYTADKPSTTVRKFRPILNHLERVLSHRLGEPVHLRSQIASTYKKGIEDLVGGKIDIARFGPAPYVMAKSKSPGISILAVEAVAGQKTFNGLICVRKGSGISSLKQLSGRRFAFGSRLSTIGRYLSQRVLVAAGIRGNDLRHFEYLGRHDRVGTAIGKGDFDAGALKESTFKKLRARDVPIMPLVTFKNVTKPWLGRQGLPQRVKQALKQALLDLDDPVLLRKYKKSGFLTGNDKDYDIIRDAITQAAAFTKRK